MAFTGINFKKHTPFLIFFSVFFITGLFIYNDYGISWDEPISRETNGLTNYQYIINGNYDLLINSPEKYHGPIIEIILVGIEKGLNLTDFKDIFLLRHLFTFLLFSLALIFFYLIGLKSFKSQILALIGCLFLVLSPRIFADAFYNYKDITFMCVCIFCIYTFINFLQAPKVKNIFFHSLTCAILIDIRIVGIIIPVFTIIYSVLKFYSESRYKKIYSANFLYLLFLIPLIILFWPVLWKNPFEHFVTAFSEMKKYNWDGFMLFNGQNIQGKKLPLSYIPVWIGITTPILYLILFFIGIVYFFKNVFDKIKINLRGFTAFDSEWVNFYIIFSSITAIIIFKSVIYDGWRHLFYIYPSIIFFTIYALNILIEYYKKIKLSYAVYTIIFLSCASSVYSMVTLHPYEHLYFNKLTRGSMNDIKKRFEMDYWGLSYLEGLRYIVDNDKREIIKIAEDTYPGETNSLLLDREDRERLFYTSFNDADYFVTAYRLHPEDFPYKETYSVIRGDAKIMTVFTMPAFNDPSSIIEKSIYNYKYDFNTPENIWDGLTLVAKENMVDDKCSITQNNPYSSSFRLPIDSSWSYSGKLRSKIEFDIFSKDLFKFEVVVQIDSANGKLSYWKNSSRRYSSGSKWVKMKSFIDLPDLKTNDLLKIYLITPGHQTFLMDNFSLTIYDIK